MSGAIDTNLIYRAFIIVGLVSFGFYLAFDRGLVTLALTSDRSYISYVIVALYLAATGHWLWLAHLLTRERRRFASLTQNPDADPGSGPLADLLRHLRAKAGGDATTLLASFGDELANRHAFGHFASDVLLKLGLLGTIVGFILMLLPVAEISEFEPAELQRLLSAMGGGMAVALYTTLAGLVTSTLLKLQYHVIDASAADLATRLEIWVDVGSGAQAANSPREESGAT